MRHSHRNNMSTLMSLGLMLVLIATLVAAKPAVLSTMANASPNSIEGEAESQGRLSIHHYSTSSGNHTYCFLDQGMPVTKSLPLGCASLVRQTSIPILRLNGTAVTLRYLRPRATVTMNAPVTITALAVQQAAPSHVAPNIVEETGI